MKLISTVIFYFLVFSFSALAITDPELTPSGCSLNGQTPTPSAPCCNIPGGSLVVNRAGQCDMPPVVDPAISSCPAAPSTCGGGTGCFPQRTNDIFSKLIPNNDEPLDRADRRADFVDHIGNPANLRGPGAACSHSRECASYNCVAPPAPTSPLSGVCAARSICRFADLGENAGSSQCGPGLIRGAGNICEPDPEAVNPVYLGPMDPPVVNIDPVQCQMEMENSETQTAAMRASILSLRAMEWIFSTITVDPADECFEVVTKLRNEIGIPLRDGRKGILAIFSSELADLERDFGTFEEARMLVENGEGAQVLTINGVSRTAQEIYSAQTNGIDGLIMMKRRNNIYQNYEAALLELLDQIYPKLQEVQASFSSVLTDQQELAACEASKYRKKTFFWQSWSERNYLPAKDRWAYQYDVTGSAPLNRDIINREKLNAALALVGGKPISEVVAEFTSSKFFLMDPLLFEGMNFNSYGTEKQLRNSSFLFIFGRFQDLRKARFLPGSASGSFSYMHGQLENRLRSYYRSLKTNASQENFIYEPELASTAGKDCFNDDPDARCGEFETYLDNLNDQTFAYFLAWSFNKTGDYAGYFPNQSYRSGLIQRLLNDMVYLAGYYETLINVRNTQNSCIDRVLRGIEGSGILDTSGNGINPGTTPGTYNTTSGAGPGSTGGARSGNTPSPRGIRNGQSINLPSQSLRSLNASGIRDNIGNSAAGGRGIVGATASANFAARREALKKANAKAIGAGVNVAGKKKVYNDIVNSFGKSSVGGSGEILGSKVSGKSGISNSNIGKASVSSSDIEITSNAPVGIKGDQGTVSLPGNTTGLGGYNDNSYGSGNQSNTNTGTSESTTGLSNAEKERIASEYDRRRHEFEGNDEDGIFLRVSKAYVRNLDRILTKKKIED